MTERKVGYIGFSRELDKKREAPGHPLVAVKRELRMRRVGHAMVFTDGIETHSGKCGSTAEGERFFRKVVLLYRANPGRSLSWILAQAKLEMDAWDRFAPGRFYSRSLAPHARC